MIRDQLIRAIEILENHKFGAKTKSGITKAKKSATAFQETISALPEDLQKVLKNMWLIEYNIYKLKGTADAKQLRKKSKELRIYINEQINSIVFP